MTSAGMSRKAGSKSPHQHDGPFHEARDFGQQRVVIDQFKSLRHGQIARIMQDDVAAAGGIEHDFRLLQRRHVIVKAAHTYFAGRKEAMTARDIAAGNAIHVKAHDFRLFGINAECAENGMQRTHPAQGVRARGSCAPPHALGPWECTDNLRQDFSQHFSGCAAAALDHGDVKLALALGIFLDLRLIERGQSGAFEKACDSRFRRADTRAFFLLARVWLAGRQAGNVQRQTARRRKGRSALIDEATLDQRIRDELFQVVGRLLLHAGGNFFAEQFEEKIRHGFSA